MDGAEHRIPDEEAPQGKTVTSDRVDSIWALLDDLPSVYVENGCFREQSFMIFSSLRGLLGPQNDAGIDAERSPSRARCGDDRHNEHGHADHANRGDAG